MADVAQLFGPWGFLPVVVPLFAFVAARLGALAFAGARARFSDRAVAGVVLAFAAAVAGVRLFACVHAATPRGLVALFVIVAGVVGFYGRRWRFVWPALDRDLAPAPLLVVAAVALTLATVAALWLPVWQWDSLGYHLPFVHFTLAAGGVDGIPHDLAYIGTYPHDVELFFVGLRACLPDDRLIDLGQVPFGLAGAIVTAALARRADATPTVALATGAAWLVVPAVFLQLPTNYVDVATAAFLLAAIYFVTAPPSARHVLLGGLALGLLVGSKPSGPLPALVLFTLMAVRAVRAGHGPAVLGAAALIVTFGGESYLANVWFHHNPVWPVSVDLGPIHLPGKNPIDEVLAAGAAAPHLVGSLPWRFVRSLVALTSAPVFDMRVGGFGPLFLFALPFAVATLLGQRSVTAWIALASTVLSPDPAVARYVLAFPAFVLATASPWLIRMSARGRVAMGIGVGVLAALQLVYAAPGLAGEGPSLWSYAGMTDDERAVAVGADGPPLALDAARRRVGAGEAFAFDENMDLSDMAWDVSQSYRVVVLPRALAGEALGQTLALESVRVMAVGDEAPAGEWATRHPSEFERLSALPACRKGSCSLFVRR
jgi:hypothetical protein